MSLLTKLKQTLTKPKHSASKPQEPQLSTQAPQLNTQAPQLNTQEEPPEHWKPFPHNTTGWQPEPFTPQKIAPPEWHIFRRRSTQKTWRPQPYTPQIIHKPNWHLFQPDTEWQPLGCTKQTPYRPSPLPKGFFQPYKRPSRLAWDEIPDDVHEIRTVGSAERIYASERPRYPTGYSLETPGAGVMRYRRQQ